MGRSRRGNRVAMPPAAHHLQPQGQLGGVAGLWGQPGPLDARVGPGLGARAPGPGAGLVSRAKFETAPPLRPKRPPGRRPKTGLAGPSPAGGDAAAAQLLDDFTSQRITERSGSPGSPATFSGSSAQGTNPAAPSGRAPRPSGGGCRTSTKTVTRRRAALPPLAHRLSRAERQTVPVGSESRATRWGDSCGANQRRSARA